MFSSLTFFLSRFRKDIYVCFTTLHMFAYKKNKVIKRVARWWVSDIALLTKAFGMMMTRNYSTANASCNVLKCILSPFGDELSFICSHFEDFNANYKHPRTI